MQNKGKEEFNNVSSIKIDQAMSATRSFKVLHVAVSLLRQRLLLAIYKLLPMLNVKPKQLG